MILLAAFCFGFSMGVGAAIAVLSLRRPIVSPSGIAYLEFKRRKAK